jgi:hypothetical protein
MDVCSTTKEDNTCIYVFLLKKCEIKVPRALTVAGQVILRTFTISHIDCNCLGIEQVKHLLVSYWPLLIMTPPCWSFKEVEVSNVRLTPNT